MDKLFGDMASDAHHCADDIMLSTTRISISEVKTLAFRKLPSHNIPKKALSVVCSLAYYRKFIPNFAKLAKPK
jgi:hypothetical protein